MIELKNIILYFRNVSSNNPTKMHIIKESTNKSFCGFDNYLAELHFIESDKFLKTDICRKCLKAYKNQ